MENHNSNSNCFDAKNLKGRQDIFRQLISYSRYSLSSLLDWTTKKVDSRIFESGGYEWRLCLSSRGSEKEDGDDHISLCLSIANTDKLPSGWEVLVNFKLFLFNQIKNEFLSIQDVDEKVWRFHCLKTEWGFDQLLPFSTFSDPANGFLVDDSCAFGAKIYFIKPNNVTFEILDLSKTFDSPSENIFTWKIKDFCNSKRTAKLQSPEFIIGGRKWRLELYPNGIRRVAGKSMSFFLTLIDFESDGASELEAKFKLRIRDQVSGGSKERQVSSKFSSSSPKNSWGFVNFLSLEDLKDATQSYLLDNTLVLELEILGLSKVEEIKICDVSNHCKMYNYLKLGVVVVGYLVFEIFKGRPTK